MKALSSGAIAVYEVIERHYSLCGQSPSQKQIMADTGLKSKTSVTYHLDRLEQAGWITREPRQPHAIIPIKYPRVHYVRRDPVPGWVYAAPDYTDTCPACDRYQCAAQQHRDDSPSGRNQDCFTATTNQYPVGLTSADTKPNADDHADTRADTLA